MVRLKSRTQWIPWGFQFVDAPISEKPLGDLSWSFERLCQEVLAIRERNPRFKLSTDINVIRNEVDQQNALRVLGLPKANEFVITGDPPGPLPNRQAPRQRSWPGVVGAVKRAVNGASVLAEWIGEGGVPVPNEQANERARVCAECPKNAPGVWTDWFTESAAEVIREQMAMRNDLNLATPFDDRLNVCDACGCPLRLKVHAPLKHITAHLSDKVRQELDPRCWILSGG